MPNGGVKSSRSSPYWRNASPPPRRNLSSEQSSNRVGQQLLRTLAQSLPSGQEAVRSRSSCPTTPRRRRQASVCRSMGSPDCVPLVSHSKLKTPVRLKAGMPVKPVLGVDPPNSKTPGQSNMASAKRRNESPTVKAKSREEEFNKIPELHSEASVAKAREKEFEKIPSRVPVLTEENKPTDAKDTNNSIPETQENLKPETENNLIKEEEKPTEGIPETDPKPSNSKIIPCFRGEYPTRHRPGTCQWFQSDVPNCGNIVTICDEEQQIMGEAEIVTACEVTEAHFLSLQCEDDNMNNEPPSISRCSKCTGCPQQQNGNWFGQQRSCPQQQQPCFQQKPSCLQQQPSCLQQQPSCLQQQPSCLQQPQSCFQQQQRNCGRNPPCPSAKPKGCLKCQEQQQSSKAFAYNLQQSMQQQVLPPMQNMYPCQQLQQVNPCDQMEQQMQQQGIEQNNYGLTEMLAEELKKQMLEAQAQIAQVQLQLNSACGATRVRQMHVLSQNATDVPRWAPETQFMDVLAEEHDVGDAQPDETMENGEEDQGFNAQLDQHALPASFPCQTIESTRSETIWTMPSAAQSSQQQMQFGLYPVPLTMPNQNNYFQPNPQQFSCQMAPFQQQQQQQQMAHCQQIQSCRAPPCPPKKPPPCQQKQQLQQQRLSCQQQQPIRSGPPAQSNKCSHSPQFCPSCCCQRYAQMRFMMPRCWLR